MDRQPFRKGSRYRVRREFSGIDKPFLAEEELIFVAGAYSRYDDCYVYEFRDKDGATKVWAISTTESSEAWRELLSEI